MPGRCSVLYGSSFGCLSAATVTVRYLGSVQSSRLAERGKDCFCWSVVSLLAPVRVCCRVSSAQALVRVCVCARRVVCKPLSRFVAVLVVRKALVRVCVFAVWCASPCPSLLPWSDMCTITSCLRPFRNDHAHFPSPCQVWRRVSVSGARCVSQSVLPLPCSLSVSTTSSSAAAAALWKN